MNREWLLAFGSWVIINTDDHGCRAQMATDFSRVVARLRLVGEGVKG